MASNVYNVVTLPLTQTFHSASGEIVRFEAPMYAYSESNELSFKNLCGVVQLKLNIPQSVGEKVIYKIMVGSNEPIYGQFSVTLNNGDPTMEHIAVDGQNDKVMELDCGSGVTCGIGTTTSFYIYLPAQTYTGLQFTFFATDGSHLNVKLNASNFIVERSKLYPIALNNPPFDHPSEGRGLFSVSPTKQVYFSPGNLQYRASTQTWRFAEHQYDFVGGYYAGGDYNYGDVYVDGVQCDNASIGGDYTGWIDLFGWGTGNNPTETSLGNPQWDNNINGYNYVYLNYNEWGVNVSNNDETWYTLTNDEWDYLFNSRDGWQSKVGTGQVRIGSRTPQDYIHGLIILPDNWNPPTGIDISFESWWADNNTIDIFTPIEWELMEANGAVFLPEAGRRSVTTVGMQSAGYYWSATGDNENDWPGQAYYVEVDGSGVDRAIIRKDNRGYGASVRLVKDVSNKKGRSKNNIIYFGQ